MVVAAVSMPLHQAKAVVYSVSVPEVRDLLMAARNILSVIIASRGELEAELSPTQA